MENPGIMGSACPADRDVGEVAMIIDDALQHDGEKALLVDELHGALGWSGDGNRDALDGSHASWKAHSEKVGNDFLWVYKVD